MDNSLSTVAWACFLLLTCSLALCIWKWVSQWVTPFLSKSKPIKNLNSCWECIGLNSNTPSSSWLALWWKATGITFQETSFWLVCPHTEVLCQSWSPALPCICRTFFSHNPPEIPIAGILYFLKYSVVSLSSYLLSNSRSTKNHKNNFSVD